MAKKVCSIILSNPEKSVYEVSYIDYRWNRPGYTENRKYKRFRSIDSANNFLKELYMNIDGQANVTNYTYKPKNENGIERSDNSGLIHIKTVNEYANFMFFTPDSSFNQPYPSTAFVSEHVVGSVLNYMANQKYKETKQMLQKNMHVLQKTA